MRKGQYMHFCRGGDYPEGQSSLCHRFIGLFLCLAFILPGILTGCSDADKTVVILADYGEYGAQIAQTMAEQFPFRKAYSPEEKEAGVFIKKEFEKLGYTVEEQTFSSADQTGTSTNYIVKIPGEGLLFQDQQGNYIQKKRQVIVGAHYDTTFGSADSSMMINYDGIQDNACGIGALLALAKEIRTSSMGYDVVFVAFGAGSDSYAGATAYEARMTAEEIASIDVMYCIESIYAGDKLYASAGWNSLVPGQKYEMRRKLYEVYDVVYENQLSNKTGVDLLYNESGFSFDIDSNGSNDIYREVTTTLSDYVPFDRAGIPIVFFESYDYNYTNIADMKETKNLKLQENGGLIRRTNEDSLLILEEALPENQLETRINSTAYILLKSIEKGAHNSLTKEAFADGATIAQTIHILATVTPAGESASTPAAAG